MRRPAPFALDFVARRWRASPLGWALLAVGAAMAGAGLSDWQTANDAATRWASQAEHWQARSKRLALSRHETVAGDAASLRPQAEAAARAVARLATPWGDLYRSLEGSLDDTVSLLVVSPNADKGEVRLNGEAKNFAALRGYLQRLNASGALTEVRLLGQEVKQSDAQRPIVFSIVATWQGAS